MENVSQLIDAAPATLTKTELLYLLTIYRLGQDHSTVRSVHIADELSVTRACVSKMLKRLIGKEVVVKEFYRSIRITPEGLQTAEVMFQKYLTLYHCFINRLGVSESTAHKDAMSCLTVLSEESLQKLQGLS